MLLPVCLQVCVCKFQKDLRWVWGDGFYRNNCSLLPVSLIESCKANELTWRDTCLYFLRCQNSFLEDNGLITSLAHALQDNQLTSFCPLNVGFPSLTCKQANYFCFCVERGLVGFLPLLSCADSCDEYTHLPYWRQVVHGHPS